MSTVKIKESVFPLSKVMKDFVEQTENQMRWNMKTQQIFPFEVYPGYKEINEARHQADPKNAWYSTGAGYKSIRGQLVSATEVGNVTIRISFLDHLRFADMGVGAGTKWTDVETAKKLNYKNRYISRWERPAGSSHRPALMPEVRHLATRVQNYLADFYGYTEPLNMVKNMKIVGKIQL